MKKIYFTGIIFLITIFSCTVSAEEQNVNIQWTMNDTTNVIGYKLYYSYNQNMTINDSSWHSDCGKLTSSPSAENPSDIDFTMLCNNIPITHYPIYCQIAAVTTEKEVPSDTFAITIPPDMLPGAPTNLTIIN